MKWIHCTVGLALVAAGLCLAGSSWVRGQQEERGVAEKGLPPLPGLPELPPAMPAPPASPPAKPQASPVADTPAELPAATRDTSLSIKDIVIDATQGPSNANPTGRQEPGVSLEWLCPSTVIIHQPVTCTLIVKSLSVNRLHQVVVSSRVPEGATVKATEPKATVEGDILLWTLGTLEPRQEKRLDVLVVPTSKGSLPCHAFVTFTGSATARLEVREPRLDLKAAAPTKMVTGDAAAVLLTVTNPGDARAEQVKLQATLSDGLESVKGRTLEFNLDSLGPNESRTVIVQCGAKLAGSQLCSAVATAEPQLEARTSAPIQVLQPELQVEASGPPMRYLDRHGSFHIKIANPGTATAQHVTLANAVPAGFKVHAASHGGRHDFSTGLVVWFLGDLEPGHSKEVQMDLVAINPGEFKNRILVTAARGLKTSGEIETRIEGLPGLLMELVDVADPVELSKDISYEIRVTNTGTKTETNLQLSCTLPERMQFVAARCGVGLAHRVEGREVIFEALPRLAPRADVIYRVNVRGLAPGDLRFQARMRADGLESPVLREESTRVFGDDREPVVPRLPR